MATGGTGPRKGAGEDGVATVLVLSLVSLTGLLLVALGSVAAVVVTRHRAAAAADLAALAAAGAPAAGNACAEARRVAAANGAELTACRLLADGSVMVEVRVWAPPLAVSPRVRARAGPPHLGAALALAPVLRTRPPALPTRPRESRQAIRPAGRGREGSRSSLLGGGGKAADPARSVGRVGSRSASLSEGEQARDSGGGRE